MIVNKNFYDIYVKINTNFEDIMKIRINNIKNEFNLKNMSIEKIIDEYFVEIFSWSVLPYSLLNEISNIIINNNCNIILDPCCGNAFHTYLFETFTELECLTYDIQDEKDSWTKITEIDCLKIWENIKNHYNICLLLSWIDYEELCLKLLDKYNGNIILSIGNYHGRSPKYLKELNKKYKLYKSYELSMPWNLNESIEIYIR